MAKFKARQLLISLVTTFMIAATIFSGPIFATELEEILVTAQRRSANLQNVPISISAFSANELEKAGIESYDDLGLVTPGLQTGRQIGSATPYLRGIGAQSTQVGVESATSIYLDDVYVSGVVDAVMSFNNIERIEVLKGPQGTLFGRNTTGGVIHVITKDPTHESQAKIGVHFGNYEVFGGKFYGSAGVTNDLAVDLAVAVQRQDGRYGINQVTGDGVGYDEYTRIRTKAIWTPGDNTVVKLSARYSEREDDGGIVRQCDRGNPFGCLAGTTFTGDLQDTNTDIVDGGTTSETWAIQGKVEHSFDKFDFVSISAYKENENLQHLDQDATPFPLVDAFLFQTIKTFSQEFQLVSNDDSKSYSWITGLYFWDNNGSYDPARLGGAAFAAVGGNIDIFATVDTKSYAAFAEGTFDLSERVSLTAGLRWTKDERVISGHTDFGPVGSPPAASVNFREEVDYTEPTWRLSVNYQMSDDILLFASYNRGFKSGVFGSIVSNGVVKAPADPEILDAYEFGMKGDFMDSKLRLNIGAFFYDYEGLQLQLLRAGVSELFNAGSAEMYGVEADGQIVVTDNLNLRFGVSYLHSEYTDFPTCLINTPTIGRFGPLGNGNLATQGDCTGNQLIRAPEYTFNIGVVYERPTEIGLIGASATLAYNDGFFWEPDNRFAQDAYEVLNASLSWTSNDEKYKVRFYGKNLLDEEYSNYSNESSFGDTRAPAPPRTYGIALEVTL